MEYALISLLTACCGMLLSNAQWDNNTLASPPSSPTVDPNVTIDDSGLGTVIIVVIILAVGIPVLICIGIGLCCYCGASAGSRAYNQNANVPQQAYIAQPERMLGDEREVGLDHNTQRNIIKRMSENNQYPIIN